MISAACSLFARLRGNTSGMAAVEFALTAPIALTMFLGGAEITNYTITKLRVSQLALHVSDNGSRIGSDSVLAVKQISEKQINDLLIGANLQAGALNLQSRGKVVISSLEPKVGDATKFYVHWQRCYGQKTGVSGQYAQGTNNLTAIGPVGKQVTSVPAGGAVIFVEIFYDYKPLISSRLVPNTVMKDTAAMVVRDDRDYSGGVNGSGVYNSESVTASTC